MVRTRRKRLLAFLLLVLLGIFTALLIAVQRLPELAQDSVLKLLATYGVNRFETAEIQWQLDRAATSVLTFSGLYQGWQYDCTLTEIDVRYHWRQLLAGTTEQLTIGSFKARLQPVQSAAETAERIAAPLPTLQWLNRVAAFSSPVKRADVGNLEVEIDLLPQGASGENITVLVPADGNIRLAGRDIRLNERQRTLTGHLDITGTADQLMGIRRIELGLEEGGGQPWLPVIQAGVEGANNEKLDIRLALMATSPGSAVGGVSFSYNGRFSSQDMLSLLSQGADIAPEQKSSESVANPVIGANLGFSGVMRLPAELHLVDSQWLQAVAVDAAFAGEMHTGTWPDQGIREATLAISGRLQGDLDSLNFNFDQPLALTGTLDGSHWQQRSAILPWRGDTPFDLNLLPGPALDIHPLADAGEPRGIDFVVKAHALAGNLTVGESDRQIISDFEVQRLYWRPGALELAASLRAKIPYGKRTLPAIALDADLRQGQGHWQGQGSFEADTLQLQGDWQGDFSPGESVNFTSDLKFDSLASIVDELRQVGLYSGPARLTSGLARASYKLAADLSEPSGATSMLRQQLEFSLSNLNADYEGVRITGGSADGKFESGEAWKSLTPLKLAARSIGAGIPVTDLRASLWLQHGGLVSGELQSAGAQGSTTPVASHWRLDNLEGSLFSGQLSLAEPAAVEYPFRGNRVQLLLSGLRLDQILALYASQGLSGTGVLSGRVPLTLDSGGIRVRDGLLLSASPGGRIAYQPPAAAGTAVAAGNEQLGMTLKLLQDFRYDQLRVSTNFEPDGQLLLGLNLSGRNPAVYQGRLVNFNINVEENLFDLLKVLKMSGDLGKKLESQLQKRQ